MNALVSLIEDKPFFFKKDDTWEICGNEIQRVPGTWYDLRHIKSIKFLGKEFTVPLIALWCCPACKTVSAVSRLVHEIDPFGHVFPRDRRNLLGKELRCTNQCAFNKICYFLDWDSKPLYAIAFERKGKPELRYCHATSELEARAQLALFSSDKIVGIAPVIGYKVNGENENDLST